MGERVRGLREARGMTLAALAKRAGYPYPWQLGKVELDGVMPDPERLAAIADELGTTVEHLLTGEAAPRRAVAPPPAHNLESWLALLPAGAPPLAVDMARSAWTLAVGQVMHASRPALVPTLTPPSRSASQSLVPPKDSGMRSKAGKKSVAPPAVKRRTR